MLNCGPMLNCEECATQPATVEEALRWRAYLVSVVEDEGDQEVAEVAVYAQSALIASLATGAVWISVPALSLTGATNRRGSPFRQRGEVLRSWQLRLLRCLRLCGVRRPYRP